MKSGRGVDKSCAWWDQLTIRIDPSLRSNHHRQQQAGPGWEEQQTTSGWNHETSVSDFYRRKATLCACASLNMFITQFAPEKIVSLQQAGGLVASPADNKWGVRSRSRNLFFLFGRRSLFSSPKLNNGFWLLETRILPLIMMIIDFSWAAC